MNKLDGCSTSKIMSIHCHTCHDLRLSMHLYLGTNPRTLYLVTGSYDEKLGRPRRALEFKAAEGNSTQVVVRFLPKNQVNLSNLIRVTNRVVKGCLGLISIDNGMLL